MDSITLRLGVRHERVGGLKAILNALEYPVTDTGDEFDVITSGAVEAFQNDFGLPIDGVAGHRTWAALDKAYQEKTGASYAWAAGGEPYSHTDMESVPAVFHADEEAPAESSYHQAQSEFIPQESLKEGDSGECVAELQDGLRQLGFLTDSPCGVFGSETAAAVRTFQREEGLPENGVAGPDTRLRLDQALADHSGSPSLTARRKKPPGARVKELQLKLAILGYYDGPLDGELGPATLDGVRRFQRACGLHANGNLSPDTWDALDNAFSAPPEPAGEEYRPNLREGASGQSVTRLQERLAELGFSPGKTDGRFGPDTAEAVRRFQRDAGMVPDAIIGPATWAALDQAEPLPCDQRPALKDGSAGDCVAELQGILKSFGYFAGETDGKFGRATAEAVKNYQRIYGLSPDGAVGPATWASLYAMITRPPEPEPEPPWMEN